MSNMNNTHASKTVELSESGRKQINLWVRRVAPDRVDPANWIKEAQRQAQLLLDQGQTDITIRLTMKGMSTVSGDLETLPLLPNAFIVR